MLSLISRNLNRNALLAAQQYDLFATRVTADNGTLVDAAFTRELYRACYDILGYVPRRLYSDRAAVKLSQNSVTNLLTYSNTFTNAAWTKTDVTVTSTNNPDAAGGNTASLLTEGSAGTALLLQAITTIASTVYASSISLKRGNTDWVRVTFADAPGTNSTRCWFNLATGAKGSQTVTGTGVAVRIADMVLQSNGFYRVIFTGSITGATATTFVVNSASADASNTRVANATYYACFSMLQRGGLATDYIDSPTTSTSANQNFVTTKYDLNNASPVDAVQTTASSMPYYGTDVSCTHRVSMFDGIDDVMTIADLPIYNAQGLGTLIGVAKDLNRTSGDAVHVVFVASTNAVSSARAALFTRATTNIMGTSGRRVDGSAVAISSVSSAEGFNFLAGQQNWTADSLTAIVNGSQGASVPYSSGTGNTSATNSVGVSIGSFTDSSSRLNGIISEVIADRALYTTAQLTALQNFYKQYYPTLP